MSDGVSIELDSPAGERLRFEWTVEALERLGSGVGEPPWRLGGEIDWEEIESVRVFSGHLDQGGIAVAALRPRGVPGHGEEVIAAALLGDEGVEGLDEVLVSTELDASGAVRRIGLELYRAEGQMPLRVAGDATESEARPHDGATLRSAAFELRAAGSNGVGRLDVLEP